MVVCGLCFREFRWSNLVTPVESAVKITTNATTYLEQQVSRNTGRRLTAADAADTSRSSSHEGGCLGDPGAKQCTGGSSSPAGQQKSHQQQRASGATGTAEVVSGPASGVVKRQLLQQQNATAVDSWVNNHAGVGLYQASDSAASSAGVFVFAADGSSSTNTTGTTLMAAGTTRHPKEYSLHELRMSILTLAVAVAAVSVIQWLVCGLWKLLRLDLKSLPT